MKDDQFPHQGTSTGYDSAGTAELEAQVIELQNAIEELESEKNRLSIEAKLAIEDAELARSFSKKNYAPLLDELFHIPSKRLRRQTAIIVGLLSITLIALIANLALPYWLPSLQTSLGETTEQPLHTPTLSSEKEALDVAQHSLETEPEIADIAPAENTPATKDVPTEPAPSEPISIKSEIPDVEAKVLSEKEIVIRQQTKTIVGYIELASTKRGFPNDYASNKTSLAQLYLVIMQNASNDNIFYESYLEAFQTLTIDPAIMPTNIDTLVEIDTDFLHAAYSAYIITNKKREKKWRYRDSDRQFSGYYSSSLSYDLGDWKIVNDTQDYQQLPKIFALNIQRISQQLTFNQKIEALVLPNSVSYLAYTEEGKNQAVKKLINAKSMTKNNNKLTINGQHIPLDVNSKMVFRIQKQLADAGLMPTDIINGIAGPKTRSAIKSFQQTKGLEATGNIDLELLAALNLQASFYDLNYR